MNAVCKSKPNLDAQMKWPLSVFPRPNQLVENRLLRHGIAQRIWWICTFENMAGRFQDTGAHHSLDFMCPMVLEPLDVQLVFAACHVIYWCISFLDFTFMKPAMKSPTSGFRPRKLWQTHSGASHCPRGLPTFSLQHPVRSGQTCVHDTTLMCPYHQSSSGDFHLQDPQWCS